MEGSGEGFSEGVRGGEDAVDATEEHFWLDAEGGEVGEVGQFAHGSFSVEFWPVLLLATRVAVVQVEVLERVDVVTEYAPQLVVGDHVVESVVTTHGREALHVECQRYESFREL